MRITPTLKLEIEHTFEMVPNRNRGDELYFKCPEPGCGDKTGHRSVNLRNGKTSCFICHKDGDFFRWARRLGYHFSAVGDAPLPDEPLTLQEYAPRLMVPGIKQVQLPRGFIPLVDEPDSVYTKFISRMARRKNLEYEDLANAGVGFTREDPKWEEYAIFPVIEYDTVVYYQGRLYSKDVEEGRQTKLFPSRNEVPLGSKYWVYNIDEVRTRKASVAIVVESILNVLSLKWKLAELGMDQDVVPVCVFKHNVSREQAVKLSRLRHLKEVCLLYDRDATVRAWTGTGFLSSRFTVSIAEMPERPGARTLDANDDVEAAVAAFENRKTYTPFSELRFRLSTLRELDWSDRMADCRS